MKIDDINKTVTPRRQRHVVGRGKGCGLGKTCGRGEKGQGARSGWSVKPGFEGGQMPLVRRIPKRGFSNVAFRRRPAVISLRHLSRFPAGEVVDGARLEQLGLIEDASCGLKVLANGSLKHALTVHANRFSKNAVDKIEKA
ncbi:MAG: 50S ribosomal protein L15, partial [Planctomycetota bacterium]|nr:50S ribosomal protein L15 [Planctomycetota bacterium]